MKLIYKLFPIKFPGELIRAIDSFLTQGSFRVKMDTANLGWRHMLTDVCQGSNPSFVLYNS